MRMIREGLRYFVAVVFILSGGVKAVDAKGFSFKLEEYFSPQVFNLPFFERYVLPIAVFVVALELVSGFALLLKIQLKKVLWVMVVMCVFFAFLTFYSAYYNVVTDCGCFGDAVKFTPWQSFCKDIVLLLGLLLLLFLYRYDRENPSGRRRLFILSAMVSLGVCGIVWGIIYEPWIDFRDYKIGTDLRNERIKLAENPSVYKTFYILKNKHTGKKIKINQDDYVADETLWKEGSPWEIQSDLSTTEMVSEGYGSEISKFKIEDLNGNDLTDEILRRPKVVLVFSYQPNELDAVVLSEVENKVRQKFTDSKIYGISILPGVYNTISGAVMDGTAIKTIARSNPFVLVLENGVITDKQGYRTFINN